MKTRIFNFLIPIFSAVIFFSACSSSTMIVSEPPGAKLYIDGNPVGYTPYSYSDTKISGSKTNLKLEKEGYETMHTFITRTEEVDIGAIVGGIFVWPVFLWTMKYYPEHYYELYPLILDDQNENKAISAPDKDQRSKVERLRELKQMLDEKLITEEEYQKAKERILKEDDRK
ncbi:MAG: PEGA domain-containing protein [Deltaproteobacteria bacterium]